MTMKAWRLDRLGGDLRLENVPMPEVRPGSILVRVEASTLMSYIKPYVEGRLPPYHAPSSGFTPAGNCVGTIEAAGKDVWQLAPGQRVLVSSLFRSSENVADPAQILIGVTSFGPDSEKVQADWPDGTLAEYVLLPASSVVPADGFEDMEATQLAAVSRFVIPYGGLVRGRLAAGETLIVNGATGAYGSAAVFVARAMGAGRVVAAGRNADKLDVLVRWRAIPHVAALMRATCLEEAGGYCRRQPHAEDDQNEVAEGAEAAQSFRLRTAKAVGDDAIHQKANRQGDQKDEQH